MIPRPRFTKHYALGLMVGTGFGLFLAGVLADSGVGTDPSTRRLVGLAGIIAIMIGGFLYAVDLRRSAAGPPVSP